MKSSYRSIVTGPEPTAKAVPLSTATPGVLTLLLFCPATTAQPVNPAITSTSTTPIVVHSVMRRRRSAAFCASTIRLALPRSLPALLTVLPSDFPHQGAVHRQPTPRAPQQNPRQHQEAHVTQDLPAVRRNLPGPQIAPGTEAPAVDPQAARPRRRDAGD